LEAFFKYSLGFLLFWVQFQFGFTDSFAQSQNFEEDFEANSYPNEFLPGWIGNEVRSTNSRIFQLDGVGRNSSKALAVQPISTFNGTIWVKLELEQNPDKKVVFWAKSVQNGTGSRPALVYYSWSKSLDGEYFSRNQLGGDSEFMNENQDFRKFTLDLPPLFSEEDEVFLRIEVNYGQGSGSAARWILDDFEFGVIEEDIQPPKLQMVKGFDQNELWVEFDEKIDPVFSLLPPAYSLDGIQPEEARRMNDSTLILTFEKSMEESKTYQFAVSQIPDLVGNFIKDSTLTFTFYDPANLDYKSLVINELMPAPRADQDLPNVEYVEIFNPQGKEFRLDQILFSNSRSETFLGEGWIGPEEYLILTQKGKEEGFMDYGKVIGLSDWPTLLNSGDKVTLKNRVGEIIDEISYSTSSWGGSEFSSEGYSLEVPNPFSLCENSEFLQVSTSILKGTPGYLNSVFDSGFSFPELELEKAYFLDSISFSFELSGSVSGILGFDQIGLDPVLELDRVEKLGTMVFKVVLKKPVLPNQVYEISIHDVSNCSGEIQEQLGPLKIVLPIKPQKGQIHLSEVLFDPISGDPKFVEIHNSSDSFLDIQGWSLANLNDQGEISQIRTFGIEGEVLKPKEYLAISLDPEKLKIRYPKSRDGDFLKASTLPSYPISGGTVVLLDGENKLVEQFNYSEEFHHPLVRDSKGVSLERVSFQNSVSDRSNWQSASGNEDFATPGRKNSQFLEPPLFEEMIKIEPKIFDPEGSFGPSFTSIQYEFDQAGWVGTFQIYSSSGNLVTSLCQNQILGTSGMFTWNGVELGGNRVKPGYYVLVVELFDLEGNTQVIKKTIIVAVKL